MNDGGFWFRQPRGLYLRPGTSVRRRPRRPVVWGLGRYGAVLPGLGLPVMTDGGRYAVPSMRLAALPAMYPGGSPGGPLVYLPPAFDPSQLPAGPAPPPPVVPVAAVPTLPAPVAAPVTSAPIPLWVWVAGGAALFLFLRGGSGAGAVHRGR